jgi:hypothetical protein
MHGQKEARSPSFHLLGTNDIRWIFYFKKTEIRRSMAKVGERVLETRGKRCVAAK